MKTPKRNTEVADNFDKNQKTIEKSKLINGLKKTITSLLAGIIASQTLNAKNTDDHEQKHDKKMYDSEYIAPIQESGDKKDDTIFNAQSTINNNLNKETGEKPPEDMEGVDGPLKYYKNLLKVLDQTKQLGVDDELVTKINSNIKNRDRKDMFIADVGLERAYKEFNTDSLTIIKSLLGVYSETLGLTDDELMTIMGENPTVREIAGQLTDVIKTITNVFETDIEIQKQFKKNGENIEFNNMLEGIVKTINTAN